MSDKYQIFHNAIFNTASWIFSAVISLVFMPYIVHKLGADGYGVLVLVLSVIGYFAVLDLNLGDAMIKYVAEYHAENDINKVNDVINSVLMLFLVLGFAGGICILLLSGTIVTRLLNIRSDLQPAALFAFNMGSIGIFLTMMSSALAAIPNGVNRYDITSKVSMAMGLVTNLVTVFLLYFGQGLKEIVVLNLVMSMLAILIYAVASKKLLPGLKLRLSLSFTAVRKVLNYGLFSMMSRLSGIVQFHGVRLLAGAILGASSITYYVVPFNVVSRAMAITFRVGAVIFPVISSLQGKRDFESVVSLYLKSSRLIFTISTAICLPLFLFGDRFLVAWMGQQFKHHTGIVMLLLTLSVYIDACTNVPTIVLNGMGMPKICGYFSMINAAITTALVYPLSKYMGISGVALSVVLGQIFFAPVFIIYVNNKVLKLSITRLLREVYLMPATAGLVTALILIICANDVVYGMIPLLGVMMATTALYLVISNCLGVFSKEEKQLIVGYLRIGGKGTATTAI